MGLFLVGLVMGILVVILVKKKKRPGKRKYTREEYCRNAAEKIAMGFFAHLKGENVPHVWRKNRWVTKPDHWIICPLAPLYLLSFVIAWDLYGSPIPVEIVKDIDLLLPRALVNEYRKRMNPEETFNTTMERFDQQHLAMLDLWSNRPSAPNAAKPLLRQTYAWMGEEGSLSSIFLDELTTFMASQATLCKDLLHALEGTVVEN